jgi:hypothetical protein
MCGATTKYRDRSQQGDRHTEGPPGTPEA